MNWITLLGKGIRTVLIAGVCLLMATFIWEASYPQRVVSQLKTGMDAAQSVSVMGASPWKRQSVEDFCREHQQDMLQSSCEKLSATDAAEVWLWRTGIDTLIVVGISRAHRVSLSDYGDT